MSDNIPALDRVTRYRCFYWELDQDMVAESEPSPTGEWVRYEDYAALLQAVTDPENQPNQFGRGLLAALDERFYSLLDEYRRALLSDLSAPHVQKQERVDRARIAIIEAYERRTVEKPTPLTSKEHIARRAFEAFYLLDVNDRPDGTVPWGHSWVESRWKFWWAAWQAAQLPVETRAEHWLGELLAVIHGDGGHYQHEHGNEKASKDAIEKVSQLKYDLEMAHGPSGPPARETAAEPMVMPPGPWEQRWNGSPPQQGDSIFCNGERIAYLGDQHHDDVTRLVYEHNCAVERASWRITHSAPETSGDPDAWLAPDTGEVMSAERRRISTNAHAIFSVPLYRGALKTRALTTDPERISAEQFPEAKS